MRLSSYVLLAGAFVLATFATIPLAHATEGGQLDRVSAFWAALKSNRTAAQAMVAAGAEMGAGDVGGPFDLAGFDELRKNCELGESGATVKALGMEGRTVDIVEVQLSCRTDDVSRQMKADFMVENDKIAGFYLPIKSGVDAVSTETEAK